jgi:hypothetical protein
LKKKVQAIENSTKAQSNIEIISLLQLFAVTFGSKSENF